MSAEQQAVTEHYSVGGLADKVFDALRAAGKDLDHLVPDDLAPLDAFHIRGRDATRELAALAQLFGVRQLDLSHAWGWTPGGSPRASRPCPPRRRP